MHAVADAQYFRNRGAIFQLPMIVLWFVRGMWFSDNALYSLIPFSLKMIGFVIMGVALYRLYPLRRGGSQGSRTLITSDIFALTRHPMYHGMYLVDIVLFFSWDNLVNPWFWVTWVVFTALIVTAGGFQEKETLARWGEEAKEYYANTPRFIVGWLWQ